MTACGARLICDPLSLSGPFEDTRPNIRRMAEDVQNLPLPPVPGTRHGR
jgi:hypothetical protein